MRFLKHLFVGGAGGASLLADVGLLLLRAIVGIYLAFGHGRFKLPPDGTAKFAGALEKMNIPAPTAAAWAAMAAEFAGALLVALGLLTRPAAFLIVFTMAVAAFTAHRNDPWFMHNSANGRAKELAMLYLAPALALMFAGPGRFSIDALFWRNERNRGQLRAEDLGAGY